MVAIGCHQRALPLCRQPQFWVVGGHFEHYLVLFVYNTIGNVKHYGCEQHGKLVVAVFVFGVGKDRNIIIARGAPYTVIVGYSEVGTCGSHQLSLCRVGGTGVTHEYETCVVTIGSQGESRCSGVVSEELGVVTNIAHLHSIGVIAQDIPQETRSLVAWVGVLVGETATVVIDVVAIDLHLETAAACQV